MSRLLCVFVLLVRVQARSQADCVRGEPKPLLAPAANQNRENFARRKHNEAIETWTASPNVKVIITQTGCSEFVIVYTFNVTGDSDSSRDRSYWLWRASNMLPEFVVVGNLDIIDKVEVAAHY